MSETPELSEEEVWASSQLWVAPSTRSGSRMAFHGSGSQNLCSLGTLPHPTNLSALHLAQDPAGGRLLYMSPANGERQLLAGMQEDRLETSHCLRDVAGLDGV
jgi:hypothetical protein